MTRLQVATGVILVAMVVGFFSLPNNQNATLPDYGDSAEAGVDSLMGLAQQPVGRPEIASLKAVGVTTRTLDTRRPDLRYALPGLDSEASERPEEQVLQQVEQVTPVQITAIVCASCAKHISHIELMTGQELTPTEMETYFGSDIYVFRKGLQVICPNCLEAVELYESTGTGKLLDQSELRDFMDTRLFDQYLYAAQADSMASEDYQ